MTIDSSQSRTVKVDVNIIKEVDLSQLHHQDTKPHVNQSNASLKKAVDYPTRLEIVANNYEDTITTLSMAVVKSFHILVVMVIQTTLKLLKIARDIVHMCKVSNYLF